jgi:hypothetical protein
MLILLGRCSVDREDGMPAWKRIAAAAASACLSVAMTAGTVRAAEVALVTTGAVEHILLGAVLRTHP